MAGNSHSMLAYWVLTSTRDFEAKAMCLLCCNKQAPRLVFTHECLDCDREISLELLLEGMVSLGDKRFKLLGMWCCAVVPLENLVFL